MSHFRTDWIPRTYAIYGGWAIENIDDRLFVVFDDDFHTIAGPDVKLFLTTQRVQDISDRDMVADYGILLDSMPNYKGAQRFELSVTDLSDYKAIVLHCEKYSLVWGGLDLDTSA